MISCWTTLQQLFFSNMIIPIHPIKPIETPQKSLSKRERFLSLDVFRGLTICLMIIVNTPGPGADPFVLLDHAKWFGFTLADLVFPSFLFAVGNAMSFTSNAFLESTNQEFLMKVFKRTFIIFLLGFLMYWYPFFTQTSDGNWTFLPLGSTRIMGVLQRIALCYCMAALIVRYFSDKKIFILSVAILIGYWIVLYLFGEQGAELTKTGNAGTLLDKLILGTDHLYKKDLGEGIPFDPEGILSTLPSLVNVLAGYLAGVLIQHNRKTYKTLSKLLMIGIILVSTAIIWDLVFPISKKLWTSSFVLYTVGIDLAVLAILIYLIEIRKWQHGVYFFNVLGKNPLFLYLFSEVFLISINLIYIGNLNIYEWVGINIFQSIIPGPFGSLLCAVFYMLICWIIGWLLDKKRIYIKI
jgi:predicted acyltransferase